MAMRAVRVASVTATAASASSSASQRRPSAFLLRQQQQQRRQSFWSFFRRTKNNTAVPARAAAAAAASSSADDSDSNDPSSSSSTVLLPGSPLSCSSSGGRALAALGPERDRHDRLGFGFSAGGLLFSYFCGVAFSLRESGAIVPGVTPLAGASAGSLIAACVGCGMEREEVEVREKRV